MSLHNTISRRQILRIIALGGAAAAAAKFGFSPRREVKKISETRILMGTLVHLTVMGQDRTSAQTAVKASLDRMGELESILSRFKPESELSELNRAGKLENPNAAMLEPLQQAQHLSALSGGAFDITVKPLVDLYRHCQSTSNTLPSADALQKTRKLVDYRALVIEEKKVRFTKAGMSITLDGIAKGYVVDGGVEMLRRHGFENVLVEAGGDLLASGYKAATVPWKVGIQSPRKERRGLIHTFSVENQGVATSGDYLQAYSTDFSHHHIIDPRYGTSPGELASVTVIAPTAALADGLSTTLMVLGPEAGMRLMKHFPDCEAYLIAKDLTIVEV